jgi:hypothetical protein
MPTEVKDDWMTLAEAKAALRCDHKTIYRLVGRQAIRRRAPGVNHRRYLRSDVERIAKELEIAS